MNIYKHFTANGEQLAAFPFRRELAMQAYLIENPGILGLDFGSFSSSSVEIIDEELSLVGGRKSKETDGRIDILATYSGEYIGIVELKLGELEEGHLSQLEDYLKEKDQILERHCKELLGDELMEDPRFIGVLVGSSINSPLAAKIKDGHTTESGIPIAALTIQRFKSESGGVYVTTDIFFKETRQAKDTSKYIFNEKTLGKGRLVLEVLKQYVEDHPQVSFAELETVYPQNLQGSQGVFVRADQANDLYLNKGYKRHFIKPDELIKLSDTTIAVSNQWGKGNIEQFVECAESLYPIEKI